MEIGRLAMVCPHLQLSCHASQHLAHHRVVLLRTCCPERRAFLFANSLQRNHSFCLQLQRSEILHHDLVHFWRAPKRCRLLRRCTDRRCPLVEWDLLQLHALDRLNSHAGVEHRRVPFLTFDSEQRVSSSADWLLDDDLRLCFVRHPDESEERHPELDRLLSLRQYYSCLVEYPVGEVLVE